MYEKYDSYYLVTQYLASITDFLFFKEWGVSVPGMTKVKQETELREYPVPSLQHLQLLSTTFAITSYTTPYTH